MHKDAGGELSLLQTGNSSRAERAKLLRRDKEGGHMEFLKKLFGKIPVNKNLSSGEELLEAASDGDNRKVKKLLAKGADVNALSTEHGRSALIIAAFKSQINPINSLNIVRLLINHGADVNLQDNQGETALMWASIQGNEGIVEALMKKGPDVDLQNNKGWTALMYASANSHKNVLKMLLKNTTKVNLQDSDGWTALMLFSREGLQDEVKTLLEKGADVNLKSIEYDMTALMLAASKGHKEVVKTLLENGADVNLKQNKNGWTALVYAFESFHKDTEWIVKALLEKGADVNFQIKVWDAEFQEINTMTVLMYASAKGNVKVVEMLKAAGAN